VRAGGGPPPIRLLNGGDVVWEGVLACRVRRRVVNRPAPVTVAQDLRFDVGVRVEDLKETRDHAIAFVGPIRWSS